MEGMFSVGLRTIWRAGQGEKRENAHGSNVFPGEIRIVEESMAQILKKNQDGIASRDT